MVGGGAAGTPATGGFVAATRARGAEHRVTGLAEQQLLQKNIKIYLRRVKTKILNSMRIRIQLLLNADADPETALKFCKKSNVKSLKLVT